MSISVLIQLIIKTKIFWRPPILGIYSGDIRINSIIGKHSFTHKSIKVTNGFKYILSSLIGFRVISQKNIKLKQSPKTSRRAASIPLSNRINIASSRITLKPKYKNNLYMCKSKSVAKFSCERSIAPQRIALWTKLFNAIN